MIFPRQNWTGLLSRRALSHAHRVVTLTPTAGARIVIETTHRLRSAARDSCVRRRGNTLQRPCFYYPRNVAIRDRLTDTGLSGAQGAASTESCCCIDTATTGRTWTCRSPEAGRSRGCGCVRETAAQDGCPLVAAGDSHSDLHGGPLILLRCGRRMGRSA